MKFFLDNDVPDDLSFLLEHLGHEVTRAREALPRETSDADVLDHAGSRLCESVPDMNRRTRLHAVTVGTGAVGNTETDARSPDVLFPCGHLEAFCAFDRRLKIHRLGGRRVCAWAACTQCNVIGILNCAAN